MAVASVPRFIDPVPVFRLNTPFVVVYVVPPVPALKFNAVAPVTFPIAIVRAVALVPKFIVVAFVFPTLRVPVVAVSIP